MNLVKIKEKGNIDVQKISFETERDMRVMKGLFDEIMKEESTDDYLQIILENEKPVYDAINKLRSKFPNVLSLDFPNLKTNDDIKTSDKNIKDISPVELFESFYEEVKQTQIKKEEKEIVENIFNEILTKRSDK